MLALLALASALCADSPTSPTPDQPDPAAIRRDYEAARSSSGRSPEDQVRLAYWCEAHGLTAERIKHLAQAVLADPTNAAARGLLGLVARDGRWVRPDAVASRTAADPAAAALLTEYDQKRSATPYTAAAQFDLGVWADDRGLKDQARAHFTAAARLDPAKDTAWKRLGYTKHDGRWASDAQLAAERADADAQKHADHKWKPLLEKWKGQLARPTQRAEAEANFLTVTDPRAVPAILRVFGGAQATNQEMVIRLLGQIDSAAASRTLAYLAILAESPDVRRHAQETLRQRDPREFADILIARIQKPIRYEVRPVGGPGSPGQLFVEGKQFNVNRLYSPPAVSFAMQPGDYVTYDQNGLPVVNRQMTTPLFETGRITGQDLLTNYFGLNPRAAASAASTEAQIVQSFPADRRDAARQVFSTIVAREQGSGNTPVASQLRQAIDQVGRTEHKNPSQFGFILDVGQTTLTQVAVGQMMLNAQKAAEVAKEQLAADVKLIDDRNRQIRQDDDLLAQVLVPIAGRDYGADPERWKKWYVEQLGYRYNQSSESDRPTITEEVPLAYQPTPLVSQGSFVGVIGFQRMSCFGAGTLVQTATGPRAIESLAVGDVVLTQSTATGALGYRPILVTHHNPPSTTFRVKLGDDEIVASAFHRFWVAGRGWVMARNLEVGDRLRTLGGVLPVESIGAGAEQLVYNLDVAEDADFFAGKAAALVHDNSLPDPRLVPFDLPTTKAIAIK